MTDLSHSQQYEAVVIGVSFGGFDALQTILPALKEDFPMPVVVVQHHDPLADDFLATHLDGLCRVRVKEAEEKEMLAPGTVYLAPANYHLLIEDDKSLSLSMEEKVNYCRPAIDVLFESATDAYGARLIGIILTGANTDGSNGMKKIIEHGGLAVVQDPENAVSKIMPAAALAATNTEHILPLEKIASFLNSFFEPSL